MSRKIVGFTSCLLVCGLMTTASYGQLDGLYEFDGGGNGTSWDDAANWEQITDPFGNPISGDPASPPSPTTSADIPLLGVVLVDNTQPGQTALDVNIGTAAGNGSAFITGGDLTVRDMNVGRDPGGINIGLLSVSGGSLVAGDDITLGNSSVGVMTMSGGTASTDDDFFINANSSLTMTGGSLNIGDRLVTEANAGIHLDGGDIFADDDFYFFGSTQITVNSGSMIVNDKLRFDDDPTKNGKLTINGGFVRSNEFGLDIVDPTTDFRGIVEINGDGFYQVEQGSNLSNLSVQTARDLIAQGIHFITSEPAPKKLGAFSVVVPSFDGRTNVMFTQISVVPEPASVLLLGLTTLALVLRRKNQFA
ncbi:PEP-CTERM sorting domain-containing protein [Bythopirellula polymerisocia]|uniref:Ice-binding protein C-terminal domain-containing protein n=1 Tax=Bythopirellula polymerisocia TaxID=2528003 RepID=A0A5C6BZ37_9BACT|nr:PEP-CTERM sorting domain-containing protein [Bythopirellula polymerisocia]TWU17590.1 hypothetical protein Pla144_51120 [Bythopirellula polymerisocia]